MDDSNIGVVPALCIDYFSGVWSVADDGNGGTNPGKDPVENPDQPQEPGQPQNPNPPQTPAGGNQSIGVGGGSAAGPVNPTPKATTIQGKIKPKKKAFVVTWKKQASVTGYQVQYSTSKKFTAKTTKQKTVKGTSKTKLTVKKLKAGKKYYVKVRTMKKANGKTCYSKWSKVKTVKTKK